MQRNKRSYIDLISLTIALLIVSSAWASNDNKEQSILVNNSADKTRTLHENNAVFSEHADSALESDAVLSDAHDSIAATIVRNNNKAGTKVASTLASSELEKRETALFTRGILKLGLTGLTTLVLSYLGENKKNPKFGQIETESFYNELVLVVGATGLVSGLKDMGIKKVAPLEYKIPLAALSCKIANTDQFQSIISLGKRVPLGCFDRQVVAAPGSMWRVSPARFGLVRSLQSCALYCILESCYKKLFCKKNKVSDYIKTTESSDTVVVGNTFITT